MTNRNDQADRDIPLTERELHRGVNAAEINRQQLDINAAEKARIDRKGETSKIIHIIHFFYILVIVDFLAYFVTLMLSLGQVFPKDNFDKFSWIFGGVNSILNLIITLWGLRKNRDGVDDLSIDEPRSGWFGWLVRKHWINVNNGPERHWLIIAAVTTPVFIAMAALSAIAKTDDYATWAGFLAYLIDLFGVIMTFNIVAGLDEMLVVVRLKSSPKDTPLGSPNATINDPAQLSEFQISSSSSSTRSAPIHHVTAQHPESQTPESSSSSLPIHTVPIRRVPGQLTESQTAEGSYPSLPIHTVPTRRATVQLTESQSAESSSSSLPIHTVPTRRATGQHP